MHMARFYTSSFCLLVVHCGGLNLGDAGGERGISRINAIDDQCCYRAAFKPAPLRMFYAAQTISSLAGWALVGGVLFPHRLVVEPSPPLGLSAYMRRLAADCP